MTKIPHRIAGIFVLIAFLTGVANAGTRMEVYKISDGSKSQSITWTVPFLDGGFSPQSNILHIVEIDFSVPSDRHCIDNGYGGNPTLMAVGASISRSWSTPLTFWFNSFPFEGGHYDDSGSTTTPTPTLTHSFATNAVVRQGDVVTIVVPNVATGANGNAPTVVTITVGRTWAVKKTPYVFPDNAPQNGGPPFYDGTVGFEVFKTPYCVYGPGAKRSK